MCYDHMNCGFSLNCFLKLPANIDPILLVSEHVGHKFGKAMTTVSEMSQNSLALPR
jgi:hypothetical protein